MRRFSYLTALPCLLIVLAGCYHLMPRPAEADAPRAYADLCASCHGPVGRGDGPAGRFLRPRPRDFADGAWQRATSDASLMLVIREGGPAVRRSAIMPAHPDLADAQVLELVAYIRRVGTRGP